MTKIMMNSLVILLFISTVIAQTPPNLVSTVAGYQFENIPATSSHLTGPDGILLDVQGNIIFADNSKHRLRIVNITTGIITTFAGTGTQGSVVMEVLQQKLVSVHHKV
jgi:hypothetical protein